VDGVILLRNIVNATRVTTALTVLIPIAPTTVLATALATHLDFVSVTTAGLVWIAQYQYAAGALVTVLASVIVIAFVISLGLGRIVPLACVFMVAAATELV
jgi:hypothetical protein